MTDDEKNRVLELRNSGKGARVIGQRLGISENTIKSFLRRFSFDDIPVKPEPIEYKPAEKPKCRMCKKEVNRLEGKKARCFCSDECRMRWWREHPEKLNKKAIYEFECAFCHKPFTAYGNSTRKYCSHVCYINDRYGGGR